MNLSKQPKKQPGLREVGMGHVLLTDAESKCFDIARDYQRKRLVRSLRLVKIDHWRTSFKQLGWSRNGFILGVQCLILSLTLIPMAVWLVAKYCLRVLVFPIRYLQSFVIPKDLAAPGEKTLVGIHNAFNRHLKLGAVDYIACLNDWIRILYGESIVHQYGVQEFVDQEIAKIRSIQEQELSEAMRSLVSMSREKLSKKLGHYVRGEQLH